MPTLLSVSGQRLELEPNRTYLMGRALDSDVVVEDMAASRHHARIISGGAPDAVLLEDLGSRNGTYVNEERLSAGRKPLLDRARIRIGATLFMLRLEEGAMMTDTSRLDTGTVGLEQMTLGTDVDANVLRVAATAGRTNTEIAGQLSSFTMIDVLQLLIQTHRTGTLHLATHDQHAQVHLQDGDVLHASFRDLEGFDALCALVQLRDGIFWLVETMPRVRRTVRDAGSILLFELCRVLDESPV
jgi:pSer/pThr/pTyr-binding forkhead associated (FHA) protein